MECVTGASDSPQGSFFFSSLALTIVKHMIWTLLFFKECTFAFSLCMGKLFTLSIHFHHYFQLEAY